MKYLPGALVLAVMICIPARGEEATFSFRGSIHELDGEYSYFSGQTFEIVFSFERATEDADPGDPESGSYIGAIKSGSLAIFTGGDPFLWVIDPEGPNNIIGVKNLAAADSFFAGAAVSGPAAGNEIPASFAIELTDNDAAAFGSDALPSSLETGSFDRSGVQLTFIGRRKYVYSTLGVLTSVNAPIANP
ncbi:MAG: hypothetical protein JW793_07780 [Acidobacteria bacterium]|nr:hypothetical protein [Acidobacteriota bacterium]